MTDASAVDPIRVVVADDQALVRGSFRLLVETTPGMLVVGEAATGAEAVELARRKRPDVILMDIRMPVMDGIEATRRICGGPKGGGPGDGGPGGGEPDRGAPDGGPRTRVLVLTTFDLDSYVYDALRAGASGFLLKDSPPAELLDAIRVIAAGDALLAPRITRRLIAEFARRPERTASVPPSLGALTEREVEVLRLVASGMSNTEIAGHLVLSQATVKTHIGHLLAKTDARDRAQLVIAAYESGLVHPGTP